VTDRFNAAIEAMLRNKALTVLGGLFVIVAWVAVGNARHQPAQATTAPSPAVSDVLVTGPSTAPSSDPSTSAAPAAAPTPSTLMPAGTGAADAEAIARGFLRGYLNASLSPGARAAQCSAYATTTLAAYLARAAAPAPLPGYGEIAVRTAVRGTAATVTASRGGRTLLLRLQPVDGPWRVAAVTSH
jgi:hypothetical protein